jgi:hypothetical protein
MSYTIRNLVIEQVNAYLKSFSSHVKSGCAVYSNTVFPQHLYLD